MIIRTRSRKITLFRYVLRFSNINGCRIYAVPGWSWALRLCRLASPEFCVILTASFFARSNVELKVARLAKLGFIYDPRSNSMTATIAPSLRVLVYTSGVLVAGVVTPEEAARIAGSVYKLLGVNVNQ